MASYIPNITDVFPEPVLYTPDFNRVERMLQQREGMYKQGAQRVKNLYESVFNSSMLRNEDIQRRDAYLKAIDEGLKKVSALDLSLPQNQEIATKLFEPVTTDQSIVKDIQFTRQYQNEVAKAEQLKSSQDPATRRQYWDTGRKLLDYQAEEFKNGSSQDALRASSPSYIPNVDFVNVHDNLDEVSNKMRKYDLEAIPVVDNDGILLGRITIDDIVDVIKEEADKDYQLAAGLTQDVEADDSILQLTKARLPWLFLGLLGGVGAFLIMQMFENTFSENAILFFFTPLIAAMAGNVGVQSSAIIVQGLANDDVKGSINSRLIKEMLLATLNGIVLALFLFLFVWLSVGNINTALAISVSLVAVVIVAGLIGTFVPLFLNKQGIDPAIATGPFITTSNDIFGILIYFMIAKIILGI